VLFLVSVISTLFIENSQVLEISPGELRVRNDLNFPLSLLRDLYNIAEVANTAIDLDLVLQELFKGRDVEDFVAGRLRCVNDELTCSVSLISPSK
jgi:hypothetical protein